MVLATLQVNPPSETEGLAVPVFFTPVNLRHRGILHRDAGILSALCYNTIIAKDLGRFVESQGQDDLWTIAGEIRTQLQLQQYHIPRGGVWVHDFITNMMTVMTEMRAGPQK